MKKINKKILLVFLLVTILGIFFLTKAFYPPLKTYHSKFLKITINYPSNYQLEEKFGTITLKNTLGKIILSTSGTNYESIDEYLDNLSRLNHFTITSKEKVKFTHELATKVTINNEKRDYLFYPTKWSVYYISTSSPDLYADLEKIAKSFRYEP